MRYSFVRHFSFRLLAAVLAFLLTVTSFVAVSAEILGSPTSSQVTRLAQGTYYYNNTFYSDSVGNQVEHFLTYSPNPDVTPIITNGASVYGKRTLLQANKYLNGQGIYSAGGINADFFSLNTGVPMSNVIVEGRVLACEPGWLPAVGFYPDGSAFMSSLPIDITMTSGHGTDKADCLNKYRQPYCLYLYNSDFGGETHASGDGINAVLNITGGSLSVGGTMTATVESIDSYNGSLGIPAGKLLLSAAAKASDNIKSRITSLQIGETVTFSVSCPANDDRWNNAAYGLSATGGKLITDGQLDYNDDLAAPRTAVGITGDGTLIFYTLDGRQPGYSFGCRKETLARRLLELGCVEAINLDGGGSTSIGGTWPGTFDFRTLNSPSDGSLRSCANFIFLKKNNAPDGIPYTMAVSDWGTPVLSGSGIQLRITDAYDKSFGPAEIPSEVHYSLKKDADTPSPDGLKTEVSDDGYVTVRGNGDVYITARSGDMTAETMLCAVATPERLEIYDTATGEPAGELVLHAGDTVDLSAVAFWNNKKMVVSDNEFTWRAIDDNDTIGTIDKDGVFIASEHNGATGFVAVNAGLCTAQIPVRIEADGNTDLLPPEISADLKNGSFTATVSSQNGAIVEHRLFFDGTEVHGIRDDMAQTLYYSWDKDSDYHRISLFVKDSAGAAQIKSFDVGNFSAIRNPFPDTQTHWAKNYISYLHQNGVVNGSDDGRFRPDDNMTRTEFAIMLCNYLGVNPDQYQSVELPFLDAGEIPWWAVNYVKAIYALKIMEGELTDYGVVFKPNENIQRLEYAIAVARLLPEGLTKAPVTATDADDIPWWGRDSIRLAVGQGILNGYPDGTLKPRRSVTRAEAVKILFTVFGIGKD